MIRVRHLIPKHEIFNYLENPEVSKILLYRKRNDALKQDYLCDVQVFYDVEFNEIATIIGACKVLVDKDGREGLLTGAHHAFLNGIQSQKQLGFLTKTIIKKLIDIESIYNENLCISEKIREIIKK